MISALHWTGGRLLVIGQCCIFWWHPISSLLLHLMIVGLQVHMWTWCGGIPDSSRRCQTTSTLRFPNNNSPHFAPNLRHIYSFNLSSQILRLSGSRHQTQLGYDTREDHREEPKSVWTGSTSALQLKRRREDQRSPKNISWRGEAWSGDHRGCAVCRNKAEVVPVSRFPCAFPRIRRLYWVSLASYICSMVISSRCEEF